MINVATAAQKRLGLPAPYQSAEEQGTWENTFHLAIEMTSQQFSWTLQEDGREWWRLHLLRRVAVLLHPGDHCTSCCLRTKPRLWTTFLLSFFRVKCRFLPSRILITKSISHVWHLQPNLPTKNGQSVRNSPSELYQRSYILLLRYCTRKSIFVLFEPVSSQRSKYNSKLMTCFPPGQSTHGSPLTSFTEEI